MIQITVEVSYSNGAAMADALMYLMIVLGFTLSVLYIYGVFRTRRAMRSKRPRATQTESLS
jgi:hypothetical protein